MLVHTIGPGAIKWLFGPTALDGWSCPQRPGIGSAARIRRKRFPGGHVRYSPGNRVRRGRVGPAAAAVFFAAPANAVRVAPRSGRVALQFQTTNRARPCLL